MLDGAVYYLPPTHTHTHLHPTHPPSPLFVLSFISSIRQSFVPGCQRRLETLVRSQRESQRGFALFISHSFTPTLLFWLFQSIYSCTLPPAAVLQPQVQRCRAHPATSLAHLDLTFCPSAVFTSTFFFFVSCFFPSFALISPLLLLPSSLSYHALCLSSSSSNKKTPRSPWLLSNSPTRRSGGWG